MKFNNLSRIFQVNEAEDDWRDFDGGDPIELYQNTDIVVISIDKVDEYISFALNESPPVSVLLYGDPGIGKSQITTQFALTKGKSLGRQYMNWVKCNVAEKAAIMANPEKYYTLVDIRTAQVEPDEFKGIPQMGTSTPYTQMNPHKWVHYLATPRSAGILFLDELNQADPGVLKAAFQVVLDRAAGDTAFTDDWGIIAAGNLGTEYNDPIPHALTQRFEVYYVKADAESWLIYAKGKGVHTSVTDFVELDIKNNFYAHPTTGSSDPFPTPRSLFGLSYQIKAAIREHKRHLAAGTIPKTDLLTMISNKAAAYCGVKWAVRFMEYSRHYKKFDWATVVKNPAKHYSTSRVDELTAHIHLTAQLVNKTLAEDSEHTKEQKIQFCVDLLKVINILNTEWQVSLFHYIKSGSKLILPDFINMVITNKTSIPGSAKFIATTVPKIKQVIKGEV